MGLFVKEPPTAVTGCNIKGVAFYSRDVEGILEEEMKSCMVRRISAVEHMEYCRNGITEPTSSSAPKTQKRL